jgi:hypothetical protein
MKIFAIPTALLLAATLLGGNGCGKKEGAAEKLGEKVDGTQNHPIRDALEPDGIGEKAGKKIDQGAEKVENGLDQAGKKIDTTLEKLKD